VALREGLPSRANSVKRFFILIEMILFEKRPVNSAEFAIHRLFFVRRLEQAAQEMHTIRQLLPSGSSTERREFEANESSTYGSGECR
jgi:hypothetical protein